MHALAALLSAGREMGREGGDQALRTAMCSLAAAMPRVLSAYKSGKRPTPTEATQVEEAIERMLGMSRYNDNSVFITSKLPPLLIVLMAYSIRMEERQSRAGAKEDPVHQRLRASIVQVVSEGLHAHILHSTNGLPSARAAARTAERVVAFLLGSQNLRCFSRLLSDGIAAVAAAMSRSSPKGQSNLASYMPMAQSGKLTVETMSLVAAIAFFVGYFYRTYRKKDAPVMATGSSTTSRAPGSTSRSASTDRNSGNDDLYSLFVREFSESQVLEHSMRAYMQLVDVVGSDMLCGREARAQKLAAVLPIGLPQLRAGSFAAISAWLHCVRPTAPGAAAVAGYPALDATPVGAACAGSAALPPPQLPPRPWGHCLQHFVLVHAVTSLAAAYRTGGAAAAATAVSRLYGLPSALAEAMPVLGWEPHTLEMSSADLRPLLRRPLRTPLYLDEGCVLPLLQLFETELELAEWSAAAAASAASTGAGDAAGGVRRARDWSFIIRPRAAYEVCMRIAELATHSAPCDSSATGSRGDGGAGSAAIAGWRQPRLQLRAETVWHIAARALVAARWMHARHGPAAKRALPSAAASPPVEWWRMVAAVLRTDATLTDLSNDDVPLPFELEELTVQMLRIPIEAGDDWPDDRLLPHPPPALAALLAAGVVPALERACRWHSAAGMPAAEVLLAAFLQQGVGGSAQGFLQHLLAMGPAQQVAALVGTVGKLLHRAADEYELERFATAAAAEITRQCFGDDGGEQEVGMAQRRLLALHIKIMGALPVPSALPIVMPVTGVSFDTVVAAAAGDMPSALVLTLTAPVEGLGHATQLRRLLSLTLARWLPPLVRCMEAFADHPRHGPFMAASAMLAVWWAPSLLLAARGDSGHGATRGSAAASWRAFLERELDVVVLMGLALYRVAAWVEDDGDDEQLRHLLDGLVAGMLVQPDKVRAALVEANAISSGGDSSKPSTSAAEGAAPRPSMSRAALSGWSRATLAALPGLAATLGKPDLRGYAARVVAGLEALRAGRDVGCGEVATATAAADTGMEGHKLWAGLLLPPSEAAEGLLRCCSNPRCTDLTGDSEAGPEAEARLSACGGGCGGAARYCCRSCQRAHWRAGHSKDCGAARRRETGGAGGGAEAGREVAAAAGAAGGSEGRAAGSGGGASSKGGAKAGPEPRKMGGWWT